MRNKAARQRSNARSDDLMAGLGSDEEGYDEEGYIGQSDISSAAREATDRHRSLQMRSPERVIAKQMNKRQRPKQPAQRFRSSSPNAAQIQR